MFSIKSVKTQAVVFSIVGTIALAGVMGPGMASADGPGRDSNPSVERISVQPLPSPRPVSIAPKPTLDVGPVFTVPQEIFLGGDSTVRPGSKPHIPTPVKPKLTCMGMPATIVGTEGDDMLRGTPGNDVILGLGGNDRIYGLDGNDILCGGDGNDLIFGGPGHDRVLGERGNDRLYGGDGNDQMRGGAGMDRLYGHGGDDTIVGGYHNDYLNGGTGNDRLFGNDGGDRLDGGAGRDYLNGGADHDGCINGERYVSCNP